MERTWRDVLPLQPEAVARAYDALQRSGLGAALAVLPQLGALNAGDATEALLTAARTAWAEYTSPEHPHPKARYLRQACMLTELAECVLKKLDLDLPRAAQLPAAAGGLPADPERWIRLAEMAWAQYEWASYEWGDGQMKPPTRDLSKKEMGEEMAVRGPLECTAATVVVLCSTASWAVQPGLPAAAVVKRVQHQAQTILHKARSEERGPLLALAIVWGWEVLPLRKLLAPGEAWRCAVDRFYDIASLADLSRQAGTLRHIVPVWACLLAAAAAAQPGSEAWHRLTAAAQNVSAVLVRLFDSSEELVPAHTKLKKAEELAERLGREDQGITLRAVAATLSAELLGAVVKALWQQAARLLCTEGTPAEAHQRREQGAASLAAAGHIVRLVAAKLPGGYGGRRKAEQEEKRRAAQQRVWASLVERDPGLTVVQDVLSAVPQLLHPRHGERWWLQVEATYSAVAEVVRDVTPATTGTASHMALLASPAAWQGVKAALRQAAVRSQQALADPGQDMPHFVLLLAASAMDVLHAVHADEAGPRDGDPRERSVLPSLAERDGTAACMADAAAVLSACTHTWRAGLADQEHAERAVHLMQGLGQLCCRAPQASRTELLEFGEAFFTQSLDAMAASPEQVERLREEGFASRASTVAMALLALLTSARASIDPLKRGSAAAREHGQAQAKAMEQSALGPLVLAWRLLHRRVVGGSLPVGLHTGGTGPTLCPLEVLAVLLLNVTPVPQCTGSGQHFVRDLKEADQSLMLTAVRCRDAGSWYAAVFQRHTLPLLRELHLLQSSAHQPRTPADIAAALVAEEEQQRQEQEQRKEGKAAKRRRQRAAAAVSGGEREDGNDPADDSRSGAQAEQGPSSSSEPLPHSPAAASPAEASGSGAGGGASPPCDAAPPGGDDAAAPGPSQPVQELQPGQQEGRKKTRRGSKHRRMQAGGEPSQGGQERGQQAQQQAQEPDPAGAQQQTQQQTSQQQQRQQQQQQQQQYGGQPVQTGAGKQEELSELLGALGLQPETSRTGAAGQQARAPSVAASAAAPAAAEGRAAAAHPGLLEGFFCPITQELLVDPVVAADGFTYERAAIAAWLQRHAGKGGEVRSPMTGEPLARRALLPNHTLRAVMAEYSHRHSLV